MHFYDNTGTVNVYTTRRANGIFQKASVVSCENRIRVIGINCDQGKRDLVRVSGEFELSEFE